MKDDKKIERLIFRQKLYAEHPNLLRWLKPDFRNLDLREHKFYGVDFYNVDFSGSDLSDAYFEVCNLIWAKFEGAKLDYVVIKSCDYSYFSFGKIHYKVELISENDTDRLIFIPQIILNHDDFIIGYKVVLAENRTKRPHWRFVKLKIRGNVQNVLFKNHKCRAGMAEVLDIYDKEGNHYDSGESIYDSSFVYHVGKVAVADGFNTGIQCECGCGIHFFLSEQEADDYARKYLRDLY